MPGCAVSKDVLELAKRAVAFERAFAVYFPSPAEEMAGLGRSILEAEGIDYWISPDGRSIICVACGRGSSNPNDIEKGYCGACCKFHRT